MEEEVIQEPVQEADVYLDQLQLTNEKLDTLTLQLSEQHAELQQQLSMMYLFVMLLAILEVRKIFKGIISKVRVK